MEEIANTVTHGIGALFATSGVIVLVVMASLHGTVRDVVGCSIYGATLVLLYMASTIYHSLTADRWKPIFHLIDQICIYLLIAGTYTPFLLTALRGGWGWTLLSLIWALALTGIVFRILWGNRHPMITTGIYVVMGWLAVVAIKPFFEAIPLGGLFLILAGGLFYTGGLVFFMLDCRVRYFHTIWHLCVLGGSFCHFFAVMFYVLP